MADVSPSIAERMSEMAAEILDLRAKLARVLAVPACRDAGHTEALHIAAGCCDPYEFPCEAYDTALRGQQDDHSDCDNCEGVDPTTCIWHSRRGPQDEEAAEECPHDREPDNCCQGYDSDCEGPRRAARPEAAEVCCYDGLRPCEYPQCSGPKRSGTAPPDHPRDTCTDHCEADWHAAECAAGGTARPVEAWSDLCAGCKGYENEPDCGTCWGCLLDVDGRAAARTDTEEDHDDA